MPNARYRAGADAERALVALARGAGLAAHRAPGSKGLADVFVIRRVKRAMPPEIWAVNVKRNAWPPMSEREAMWNYWPTFGVMPVLARLTTEAGAESMWTFRTVGRYGVASDEKGLPPWSYPPK